MGRSSACYHHGDFSSERLLPAGGKLVEEVGAAPSASARRPPGGRLLPTLRTATSPIVRAASRRGQVGFTDCSAGLKRPRPRPQRGGRRGRWWRGEGRRRAYVEFAVDLPSRSARHVGLGRSSSLTGAVRRSPTPTRCWRARWTSSWPWGRLPADTQTGGRTQGGGSSCMASPRSVQGVGALQSRRLEEGGPRVGARLRGGRSPRRLGL